MNVWLLSALLVWAAVSVMYLLSRLLKRNDIMDIFWGPGFLLIALVHFIGTDYRPSYKWVLLVLIAAWSIRLSSHIFIKNRGKPEDFRYKQWRKEWGQTECWRSYLQINLLQGFFMFIVSLPIISVMQVEFVPGSFPIDKIVLFPSAMALFGLSIEAIADWQKSKFKKNNPNGLMKSGLWQYSRHPNYLGDAIFWWGIALFAFLFGSTLLGLISALTMNVLLRYVSGVPMLEKAKEGNRAYEEYKKETPVFLPFFKAES